MSLYQLQKFLFDLNRDPAVQDEYRQNAAALLKRYELSEEERDAVARGDAGQLISAESAAGVQPHGDGRAIACRRRSERSGRGRRPAADAELASAESRARGHGAAGP